MEPSYLVEPTDLGYDSYRSEYIKWMYTSENAFKCDECPARRDDSSRSELPCSQQNCWVEVTCFSDSSLF